MKTIVMLDEVDVGSVFSKDDARLVVYKYESGCYEGNGYLIAFMPDCKTVKHTSLAHCSCIGALDNEIYVDSLEDFLEREVTALDGIEYEVRERFLEELFPYHYDDDDVSESDLEVTEDVICYLANKHNIFKISLADINQEEEELLAELRGAIINMIHYEKKEKTPKGGKIEWN
jgi:hypothetical protein